MAVTLKDIAESCGVDVSTVSRALRDDPRVLASTKQRIRTTANRLGYRPNIAARRLQAGATQTIWCISPGLNHFREIRPVQSASNILSKQGFDVLIGLHWNDPAQYDHLTGRLLQGVCDGALVIPHSRTDIPPPALPQLARDRFPLCFIDRMTPGEQQPLLVTCDHEAAIIQLVQAIIGEMNLSALVWNMGRHNKVLASRYAALQRALTQVPMPVIPWDGSSPVDLPPGPIGLLVNDEYLIQRFHDLHVQQRQGWLVAGLFDDPLTKPIPQTVVHVLQQDFTAMGAQAADHLVELIRKPREWHPGPVFVLPEGVDRYVYP